MEYAALFKTLFTFQAAW